MTNDAVANRVSLTRLIVVWIALFVVPLLYALNRQAAPWQWQYSLALLLHWGLTAAVFFWIYRCLQGPEHIGLRRPAIGFVLFACTVIAAVGMQITIYGDKPLAAWQFHQSFISFSRWTIAFTAITAGFCEELIYRGYMMTELKRQGQSPFSAMVLSSLSFVLFHGILPLPLMVAGFLIAMIWALIYHKTGVLWVSIFIHGLWDVLVLLTPWGALFTDQGG